MKYQKVRKLLLQSGDRKLATKKENILAAARKSSPELANEEKLLLSINQKLRDSKAKSFGPWFTERTMNRIHQITAQEKATIWILSGLNPAYRRVILGAAALLVMIIAFNISTTSRPNIAEALGSEKIPIEEMADPVTNYILE